MGKLLFVFCLGQGHMNVCVSVAKLLIAKYPQHEVYFNVDEEYYMKIKNASNLFKPVIMKKLDVNPRKEEKFQEEFRESFYKIGLQRYITCLDPVEKIQDLFISSQEKIEKVIEKVKPDVILMDQLFNLPFVENKGLPCGYIVSTNPLYAQNLPDYPPSLSGLSVKEKHLWEEYKSHVKKHKIFEKRKKWFEDYNLELKDSENEWVFRGTKYLNLYVYPKYADYPFLIDRLQETGKWFRSSHCILDKKTENKFIECDENENIKTVKYPGKELLTSEFMDKPGKLILLSAGTIVSFHTKVMEQLLDIIGSLPHKFIVSMGQNHDQLTLPDNCVGANFLDQKELYGIVDLIISHGGNNTFCELFYWFKKPFILIPCFGDQPDNGTRVNDLGIGISIALEDVGVQSLKSAIEHVTSDEEMKIKMRKAAELSRSDNEIEKFIDELHLHLSKENI